MSLYNLYKTKESMENGEGIELDYGTEKIRVRRAGGSNSRYLEAVRKRLLNPYKRQIENETLAPEVSIKIFAEIYADTVIIGWDGVKDADGNDMPFNRTNAIKLLTDLPELFTDIQTQCQKFSNFKDAELEEEKKD